MAHYIRFHLTWNRKKRLTLGSLAFLAGSAYTVWSHWSLGTPGVPVNLSILEYAWEFCTPNVLLASFGLFVLFTCIQQPKAPRIITEISKLSFGMYLMHVFFVTPISQFLVGEGAANPLLPVWLAIPTAALLCYVCCFVVAKAISWVPGSKWIIG